MKNMDMMITEVMKIENLIWIELLKLKESILMKKVIYMKQSECPKRRMFYCTRI